MKIKPCPYCCGECEVLHYIGYFVDCGAPGCNYCSGDKPTESQAIEAHNHLSELAGAAIVNVKACEMCRSRNEYAGRDFVGIVCRQLGVSVEYGNYIHPDCPLRKGPVVLMLREE